MTPILEAKSIVKKFVDPVEIKVLSNVSLQVQAGEFVSIVGKSGCGKSTLLYILSTMDTDYDGEVWIDGESTVEKTEHELAYIRNAKIGFVFQFHYLLNEFSVLENVMLPGMKLKTLSHQEIEHNAYTRLTQLKIEKLALKRANQLSGGEKQRVAIARALINNPIIIMGDEPTGNLDKKNGEIVFSIFQELSAEYKQSLLIVTHDTGFAERTQRIITMEDGRILQT